MGKRNRCNRNDDIYNKAPVLTREEILFYWFRNHEYKGMWKDAYLTGYKRNYNLS